MFPPKCPLLLWSYLVQWKRIRKRRVFATVLTSWRAPIPSETIWEILTGLLVPAETPILCRMLNTGFTCKLTKTSGPLWLSDSLPFPRLVHIWWRCVLGLQTAWLSWPPFENSRAQGPDPHMIFLQLLHRYDWTSVSTICLIHWKWLSFFSIKASAGDQLSFSDLLSSRSSNSYFQLLHNWSLTSVS